MIAVHLEIDRPPLTRPVAARGALADQAADQAMRVASAPEPKRPGILPPLYLSFAALQFLDLDSTNKALARGYSEANPVMAQVVHHRGAAWAVKAATTTVTIVAAERLWRKNHRTAAVLTMIAANVGYALVVSNNYRKANR